MRKIEDVTLKDGRSLIEVLELHYKWLKEEEDGEKANLSCEDLSNVDLSDLNLRDIYLRGANLEGANLNYANLRGAYLRCANLKDVYLSWANLTYTDLIDTDLSGANLKCANLNYANLEGANLTCVDLRGANLTKANLIGTDLTDVKYNNSTTSFAPQCQEEGSFIGYKKAGNKIVKLLITKDAKRSSATSRKCRCSKAKVLSITSLDGKEEYKRVASDRDPDFVYEVDKIVEVKDFDENRWNECSTGIHFFITRNEAVMY